MSTTLGLEAATDKDVWDDAGKHGYTILSKDSDFRQLAFLHGPHPRSSGLRVGNVTTATVPEVLIDHYEVIEAFESAAEEALLVLPGLPRE